MFSKYLCLQHFVWISDRLSKEKVSYEKESDVLIQKINKMREESAEEYYIKKQVTVT